jgi:hypothetical protein
MVMLTSPIDYTMRSYIIQLAKKASLAMNETKYRTTCSVCPHLLHLTNSFLHFLVEVSHVPESLR